MVPALSFFSRRAWTLWAWVLYAQVLLGWGRTRCCSSTIFHSACLDVRVEFPSLWNPGFATLSLYLSLRSLLVLNSEVGLMGH